MVKSVTTVINYEEDEQVVHQIAAALRANQEPARQIRSFAEMLEKEQHAHGLQFQPKPGQILACQFGLGFRVPEMVKTRPVLVVSPQSAPWTRLCVVLPISSKRPDPIRSFHYRIPDGVVPGEKYDEAWIKGDMVIAVGCHRLDRLKVGFRKYASPRVDGEILREARRCILHATGMHLLTDHW